MSDHTYREAFSARMAQLMASPASGGDRRWGEGEQELFCEWHDSQPTLESIARDMQDAAVRLVEAFAQMGRTLADFASQFAWVQHEASVETREQSRQAKPLPLRTVPGRQFRPPLIDQRPMIRRQYARRRP